MKRWVTSPPIPVLRRGLPVMAALGIAASMPAQEVRGIARVAGSTVAASGTAVILADTSGAVVAGAITDETGRFVLRAPAPGSYRVRARRIGFLPDSSGVLRLAAGTSIEFDPALSQFAVQLQQVRVDATRRCTISPTSGQAAFMLWQDAQSALTATVASSASSQIGFMLRRFERKLDASTGTVREEKTWDSRTVNSEPYASVPAESLAVHGFVVPEGAYLVYYAPDARTLISDAFARTHCYNMVTDTRQPSLVGLAFSPADRPSSRDVSGVLWLNRESGELRFLEFHYGNPGRSTEEKAATASGSVAYRRLPGGTWVVSHWVIRMPVITTEYTAVPAAGTTIGEGTILHHAAVSRVTEVWEVGGDVLSTFPADSMASERLNALAIISGQFTDSAPGHAVHRGIAGIRVMIVPTDDTSGARTVVTDSTGSFVVDSVVPGDYVMRVGSALLDTLDVSVAERTIHVAAATRQSVRTVIPSAAAVAANLCPRDVGTLTGVVQGTIRDAVQSHPVQRARVTASWFTMTNTAGGVAAVTQSRASLTGADGHYVICGVTSSQQVAVTATIGASQLAPVSLARTSAPIRMVNFTVDDAHASAVGRIAAVTPATAAGIRGAIRDTAGHAISTASVRLDSAAWIPTTAAGTFTFTHVGVGRHVLEVRAVGFDPHAWYVTVRAGRVTVAPLTLLRVTRLAGVHVSAPADTTSLEPAGFTARRLANSGGTFIDRQQIARRGAQRMSDILRDVPGVQLAPISSSFGSRDYVFVMRGVATVGGSVCPIQYYLDGHPFELSDNVDRMIPLRDVVGIEVYPGASEVPSQFKGGSARCGVIAVWTASADTR